MEYKDFKAVTITGAFNYGRARVLWFDGWLRVYVRTGCVQEVKAELPVRRLRFLRTWDVKTELGNVILKGKCLTCGGKQWRHITFMPFDELWRRVPA